MTPKELVKDMRMLWVNDSPRMKYGTHWDRCYGVHVTCAIERLCQCVEQLADAGCEGRCGHGTENVE